MTQNEYDSLCTNLPGTNKVIQWGGAHVWKVGHKVFAIAGWSKGNALAVTFKCSETAYEILKEQPGLRPAPYLASRGLKWIQRLSDETMDDAALGDYLRASYKLAAKNLTKKQRSELGLKVD